MIFRTYTPRVRRSSSFAQSRALKSFSIAGRALLGRLVCKNLLGVRGQGPRKLSTAASDMCGGGGPSAGDAFGHLALGPSESLASQGALFRSADHADAALSGGRFGHLAFGPSQAIPVILKKVASDTFLTSWRAGVCPAGDIVQSKRERVFAQVEGRCSKRRVLRPVRFRAEALCIQRGKRRYACWTRWCRG